MEYVVIHIFRAFENFPAYFRSMCILTQQLLSKIRIWATSVEASMWNHSHTSLIPNQHSEKWRTVSRSWESQASVLYAFQWESPHSKLFELIANIRDELIVYTIYFCNINQKKNSEIISFPSGSTWNYLAKYQFLRLQITFRIIDFSDLTKTRNGQSLDQTNIWSSVENEQDCCGAPAYPVCLYFLFYFFELVFDVLIGFIFWENGKLLSFWYS